MIGLVVLDFEGGTPRYVTVREACDKAHALADVNDLDMFLAGI